MKLFLCFMIVLNFLFVARSEETTYLYKGTRICANHKSFLCLAYDSKKSLVVLAGGSKRLKFEIETVERINMQINRVYTYVKDKATGNKFKNCLVRRVLDDGSFGVDLAECDTDSKELVLAVELPPIDIADLTTDEFVLKEISYLDDGNTLSSPYCLSTTHDENGHLALSSKKNEIEKNTPIVLSDCQVEEKAYGQEFRAKGFKRSSSTRLLPDDDDVEVAAEIGMFCLSEAPDLCLGMSLTNGYLAGDKFVQVKNLTKNEAKNMHDLKMRWYHDFPNNRIATASNMDLCLEAVYNAPIGKNRKGIDQFDDVVHLGNCNGNGAKSTGGLVGLERSEKFYVEKISGASSYLEIRTDVEGATKCISIVKCVKHDNDHCTPYNSVEVYDKSLLAQGAHARLKDCNSEELVSQRFYYVADEEVTVPPTKYPTNEPTPKATTPHPTARPTTAEPTNAPTTFPIAPTNQPTVFVEPVAPTTDTSTGLSQPPKPSEVADSSGLLAMLAIVGVLSLLIILLALAYYANNRRQAAALPQEDENFLARV